MDAIVYLLSVNQKRVKQIIALFFFMSIVYIK